MIVLILLLALQKPAAPFSNPNDPDDPRDAQEYKGQLTVPKNGNVVISFAKDFASPPSCWFSGGTIPGKRPEVTKEFAKLEARPGKELKWECHGVKGESK